MLFEPLDYEMTNEQIKTLNSSGASEFITTTLVPFMVALTTAMLINKLAVPTILLKAKNTLSGLGGRFAKLGKIIIANPLSSTALIATGTGLVTNPGDTIDALKAIPKVIKAVPFVVGGYFLLKFFK